jgi:hypothetical protein
MLWPSRSTRCTFNPCVGVSANLRHGFERHNLQNWVSLPGTPERQRELAVEFVQPAVDVLVAGAAPVLLASSPGRRKPDQGLPDIAPAFLGIAPTDLGGVLP